MPENKYMNEEMKQFIKDTIKKEIPVYMKNAAFTDRKLTDTPTDSLSVVNRKYVTNNGLVANRPKSSVATVGQTYLATDLNQTLTKVAGGWVNGVASICALNN